MAGNIDIRCVSGFCLSECTYMETRETGFGCRLKERCEHQLPKLDWNAVRVAAPKEGEAMFTATQIRAAGKDGEICHIDTEHLINSLNRGQSTPKDTHDPA